jgi:hypothetical protein
MLRIILAALLGVHAAIHLLGVVKAFGLAAVEALTTPISRPMGALWLAAALALSTAAAALVAGGTRWWLPASIGVVVSQIAIVAAWNDAKAGTVVNAVIAIALIPALADLRSASNHATYRHRVRQALGRTLPDARVTTEDDLARLPQLLRGYLQRAGVVGRPRPRVIHVRFHGGIRADAASPWMPFHGEQLSTLDRPERLFFMRATRAGLPVDGLHAFRVDDASMRIRLASLVTVADVTGPTLARSETVTFLNDLCLFAPGALVDAPLTWDAIDAQHVRVRYVLGSQHVSAVLRFDSNGDLVDFKSEDRYQDAGGNERLLPWSTPVSGFRTFAPGVRLPSHGEGWWHAPEGAFAYLRIELDEISYDPAEPSAGGV